MYIKRAISFSFLLLANVFLLAHVVIFHRHHEEAGAGLIHSHCTDNEKACHHEHEHPFSSDRCCIVDNVYAPARNIVKTSCRSHTNCDCKVLYALISTPLYINDFVDDIQIHFPKNPFVPVFYTKFVSQSIGLRAPPVC
jgi:hypothetical protein